jgi:hypothetical protein
VRGLYERDQQRDWVGAAHLMHPAAQLDMPATGEHLVGRDQIMGLQENYPEPWGDLAVLRVVSEDSKHMAVAEFEIVSATNVSPSRQAARASRRPVRSRLVPVKPLCRRLWCLFPRPPGGKP